MAIQTALFMVMVGLFLATMITLKARQDLRLTTQQARRVQTYYVARAATQQALALMRQSPTWAGSHPFDNPYHITVPGYSVTAWVEPHNSHVDVVRARAYSQNYQGQARTCSQVVVRNPIWAGVLYTRSGNNLYDFRQDVRKWEKIPAPPLAYFKVELIPDPNGVNPPTRKIVLFKDPSRHDLNLKDFAATIGGQLYCEYYPTDPAGLPTMAIYNVNRGSQGWSFRLSNGAPGSALGQLASSAQNLYSVTSSATGDQVNYRQGSAWQQAMTLPPGANVTSLTAGGAWSKKISGPTAAANDVFASVQVGSTSSLYQLTTAGWANLPWPAPMTFSSKGQFQTSPGHQPLDQVAAAPNGDVYGLWRQSNGPDTVYKLTTVKGKPVWSPVPPIKNGTGGYVQSVGGLAVDYSGRLLVQGAGGVVYDGASPILPNPFLTTGSYGQLLATGGYKTKRLGNYVTVCSR